MSPLDKLRKKHFEIICKIKESNNKDDIERLEKKLKSNLKEMDKIYLKFYKGVV